MKLLLYASILFAALFSSAHAQERCSIDLSISPDIRGVRLGMKPVELRMMFPELPSFKFAQPPDEAGVFDGVLQPWDLGVKRKQFEGVSVMSLVFADGRLVKIGVEYDASARWPDVDAFAAQVSKTLALPGWAWRAPNNSDPKLARVMDCDGFRVIAVSPGSGMSTMVGLVDTAAEKLIAERYAAIEERKRRAFKP